MKKEVLSLLLTSGAQKHKNRKTPKCGVIGESVDRFHEGVTSACLHAAV